MSHTPDRPAAAPWTLTASSAALARDRAGHPAVICEGRVTTYEELHRHSNRVAHALRAAGIGPGDRVAHLARESEHYYAAILACAKTGAVMVPVNWRLTEREAAHILRDSGATLLFTEGEFLALAERAVTGLAAPPRLVRLDAPGQDATLDRGPGLRAWCGDAPDTDLDPGTGPDDPVVQIYTSGTTGLPKGAVLAHRSFFTLPAATREAAGEWIEWLPRDVNLISLPGLGIAGIGWFMHGFNAGSTNVLMRAFDPAEAVRLIEKHRVTTTFVAPAMLQMILAEADRAGAALTSLRTVAYGAAPISEGLLLRCLEKLTCSLVQIYSSTEAGSIAVCLPAAAHRPGSPLLAAAGLPCPGNEVKIVDGEGRPLPPGRVGEVCVRTPARMLGYWNLPEATARTLVDGWLHMGDAGYLDDDGYLFLCDRINDTIIVGGQNIYPAEIEKQLSEHPAVADVAVVGVPHPEWGDEVHACVLPRPGADVRPRELMTFLRGRIADYKVPVRYHLVDDLPRNPSGKILRREVRQRLLAGAQPAR
ncbi:long-chain-fatty-acid--CoA ligase [Streptomyces sp. A012304]|uniref:long-chain-fatty-acid--CoA ligase n=1 Tax=Streptomyces sp. A012304 TaxID=375446 RepID=UPI00222EFF20|nr:long-chain-fatty-acid--CoA ligase [Streptomyces sp. A012304]GKQ35333.1 acyl-CoA synthetase [Streptomyces sp. A012304]